MSASLLSHLSVSERELVEQTQPAALARLNEEQAIDLQDRVRRARNKALSQYRRGGARKVAEKGARGKAYDATRGSAVKAEILGDALARVSRRVSALSRESALALRQERIAAARGEVDVTTGKPVTRKSTTGAPAGAKKVSPNRSVAATKRHADTRATGARRQAKRDAKNR